MPEGGNGGKGAAGGASNGEMRRLRRRSPRSGAALVLVLIVLLLLTVLALEIASTALTHSRLADHTMNELLLRNAVESRRQILRTALVYDATGTGGQQGSGQQSSTDLDTEDDPWAYTHKDKLSRWSDTADLTDAPDEDSGASAYDAREIELECWVEDEHGKLNLLGLLEPESDPTHTFTRETLVRLIDIYREPYGSLDLTSSEAAEMVDQLVAWLDDKGDEEENPVPDPIEARLRSLEDLLRIPGGGWTADRLYDVADPDWDEETPEERRRRLRDRKEEVEDEDDIDWTEDANYFRQNGVPGLMRFLTVWRNREKPAGWFQININTAPKTLVAALMDNKFEEVADEIVTARRGAVGSEEEGTGDTTNPESEDTGFFKQRADIQSRIESINDLDADHPRLAHFVGQLFGTKSDLFSLHVIAKVVAVEGEEGDEDEQGFGDVVATYQYHEVVQRTTAAAGENNQAAPGAAGGGPTVVLTTLLIERRRDPYFDRQADQ